MTLEETLIRLAALTPSAQQRHNAAREGPQDVLWLELQHDARSRTERWGAPPWGAAYVYLQDEMVCVAFRGGGDTPLAAAQALLKLMEG